MMSESGGIATDKTGPEKGGACKCWASHRGGWSFIQKLNKVSVTVLDNWGNGGANFTRTIPFDKLSSLMTKAEVDAKREAALLVESADKTGFFIADAPVESCPVSKAPEPSAFDAMRDQLKQGVQVVTAPQLFPTPAELADRMVEVADIRPGADVLEPSAGTGAILDACFHLNGFGFTGRPPAGRTVAVEINRELAEALAARYPLAEIKQTDFLQCNGDLGKFDRILMNPPFINGQDIEHVKHAITMLRPGGKLVALCANGPRQNDQLRPLIEEHGGTWEPLPADTFKESGTAVNAVLLSLTA
jgi:phospholipid N-methyltransferase